MREDFIALRSEPRKLMAALEFYKRMSQVVITAHESDQLLRVLWSAMTLLRDGAPAEAAEFRYNWRLLNALGLAPSMQNCVKCGSRLDDGASWTEDGLVCGHCSGGEPAIESADLLELAEAAQLPYEKFLEWSQRDKQNNLFDKHVKKLLTFFREIR